MQVFGAPDERRVSATAAAWRGDADALNVVAPFRMPTYQSLRPTIRVRPPEEFR